MNKLALSQEKVYLYPIMDTKQTSIHFKMEYGGDNSESVPCGYEITYVVKNKLTKKQRKNMRYRQNLKTKTLAMSRGLGDSNDKG